MKYLVCDYYATGEGRTISILIANPAFREEDYEVPPGFDGTSYKPGELKKGMTETLAVYRQFLELYGSFYAAGVEVLNYDQFSAKYGSFIPTVVKNILASNEQPGAFNYNAQLYLNYA